MVRFPTDQKVQPVLFVLLCFVVLNLVGCTRQSSDSQGSLLIYSPQPTITFQPVSTATYFSNPTALTASSVAPTSTKTTYKDLPIAGSSCIPNNPAVKVRVNQVIDGDTIEIEINGNLLLLRYIGIEAPKPTSDDSTASFSAEATAKNAELVGGKEVFLIRDQEPSNGYGYLLGYIISEDVFVNYALVVEGYAKAVPYKPNISCKSVFAGAEAQAKSDLLGIWSK